MADPARRADHLGRIREEETHRPPADKDAPRVTPGLVDYLEANFKQPPARFPHGLDSAIYIAAQQAEYLGVTKVIQYLRMMIQQQEA